MNVIFWISIIVIIPFILFWLSKRSKIKEGERKLQEEARRQAQEELRRPEKKLHEEEKKRWEDEFWRRQTKRES